MRCVTIMKLDIESSYVPKLLNAFNENFLEIDFGTALENYFNTLNESSLKRIEKHNSDGCFVMISASRTYIKLIDEMCDIFPEHADTIRNSALDPKTGVPENKIALTCFKKCLDRRNKSLQADISSRGLGYIRTVGGFREGDTDVVEMSFLIPYSKTNMTESEFVDYFLKLCAKYDQDSILVKYQEDSHVFYVDRYGNEDMVFDTFRYNDLAVYFSYLLKGKDRGKKWEYIKTESLKKDIKCFDFIATYKPYDIRERAKMDGRHEIYLRDFL